MAVCDNAWTSLCLKLFCIKSRNLSNTHRTMDLVILYIMCWYDIIIVQFSRQHHYFFTNSIWSPKAISLPLFKLRVCFWARVSECQSQLAVSQLHSSSGCCCRRRRVKPRAPLGDKLAEKKPFHQEKRRSKKQQDFLPRYSADRLQIEEGKAVNTNRNYQMRDWYSFAFTGLLTWVKLFLYILIFV